MKAILFSSILLCMTSVAAEAQMTVRVDNPTDVQRQELIEVRLADVCQHLGITPSSPFIVKNAIGQEVDMQVTYDGKVLVDASVMPRSNVEFTIEKGVPRNIIAHNVAAIEHAQGTWGTGRKWAEGRLYPDRLDDVAWENDRTAYRVYGPAFLKSGGVGYGPDVWVKNTPDLIVDKRFRSDIDIKPTQRQLEETGYGEEAKRLVQDNSFHVDHGDGNDCYAVGPTLGCGAPCLMSGNEMLYACAWKEYAILDNGPLRFTLDLVFSDTLYNNMRVREHCRYSLDKGSNFNRVEVWYEQLSTGKSKAMTLAVGFPLHEPNAGTLSTGDGYMQYADPTDNPSANNCELYVGCLFPEATVTMKQEKGHSLALTKILPNEHFTYYAGTAWSKYDVRNQREWQHRINTMLEALRAPLAVTIR